MSATADVFNEIGLATQDGAEPVSRETLLRWRRAVGKANRNFARSVRSFWVELDRLSIENELVRAEAEKDGADRAANVARVFEKLRSYATIGPTDVDRCVGHSANVQKLLAQLSPVTTTGLYGTVWLNNDQQHDGDGLGRLMPARTSG